MKRLLLAGSIAAGLVTASPVMACLSCSSEAELPNSTASVGTLASVAVGGSVDGAGGSAVSASLAHAFHSPGVGFWGVSARAWEASGRKGAGAYLDKHFHTDTLLFSLGAGSARVEKTTGGWETKPAARGEVVLGNVVLGYNHVFSDSSNHDYVDIGLKFAW